MLVALITQASRANSIAARIARLSPDGWAVLASDRDRADYPCVLSTSDGPEELPVSGTTLPIHVGGSGR